MYIENIFCQSQSHAHLYTALHNYYTQNLACRVRYMHSKNGKYRKIMKHFNILNNFILFPKIITIIDRFRNK